MPISAPMTQASVGIRNQIRLGYGVRLTGMRTLVGIQFFDHIHVQNKPGRGAAALTPTPAKA